MKEIILSQGKVAFIDGEDFEKISANKWTLQKGRTTNYAYRFGRSDKKKRKIYLHREILGIDDHDGCVDHEDGNDLNCQKNNMRYCTYQQNCFNQKPRGGSSRFKGVSRDKRSGKWEAYIHKDYRKKSLGLFNSEIEAAKSYDNAAKKFFGVFALPNNV